MQSEIEKKVAGLDREIVRLNLAVLATQMMLANSQIFMEQLHNRLAAQQPFAIGKN